jgi:radical SAM protein with 4Fe4S-binding SPASM domain
MRARWSTQDILLLRSELEKFKQYYVDTFLESGKGNPFKNSFLDATINSAKIKKLEKCEKLNVDSAGNLYACDKVFSLKAPRRKRYLVGSVTSGIDNQKRSLILLNIKRQLSKKTGLRCEECPYYQYCFCPAGHYIYLLDHPVKDNRKYWANHCTVALAYIETFLKIKKMLRKNHECGKMYA